MMADAESTLSQVRLQLTTRDDKLALPENVGPILVPSCKTICLDTLIIIWLNFIHSFTSVRIINARQQSAWIGKAGSIRVLDQWNLLEHIH
jgi:hypothetical protein